MAEHARAGEKIPLPLRLRIRRDQVTGTGQAIRAVDLLFENSGGRAQKTGTPIQRFWRDAHAGRVHAINDPERAGRRRHLDQPGDHRGSLWGHSFAGPATP